MGKLMKNNKRGFLYWFLIVISVPVLALVLVFSIIATPVFIQYINAYKKTQQVIQQQPPVVMPTPPPQEPAEPDVPNEPQEPEDPQEPEIPENPKLPEEPDNPIIPDIPDEPEEPNEPIEPDRPIVPEEPENPDVPIEPDNPDEPEDPDEPIVPDEPNEPEEPDLPVIAPYYKLGYVNEQPTLLYGEDVVPHTGRYNISANMESNVYAFIAQVETDKTLLAIVGEGLMKDYTASTSSQPWSKQRTKITHVEIQDGVKNIGNNVFTHLDNLQAVNMPNSITQIGEKAFYYCKNLTNVNLSNNLTEIGESTFAFCKKLIRIELPKSNLLDIKYNAFLNCEALIEINIPNSVTQIGVGAFKNCLSLKEVIFEKDSSVTIIKDWAFSSTPSLKNINLPDKLETIANAVFYKSGLETIFIPKNVNNINSQAFDYCANIESIEVDENNETYHSNNNCIIETATNSLILGCKNSTIPSYVTKLNTRCFYGRKGLTNITIPNTVKIIDTYAFKQCTDLTSIVIPNSVIKIAHGAFDGCTSISFIIIPSTVSTIEMNAFTGWKNTQSIFFEQRKNVGNVFVTDAVIYKYSETQPTSSGNWWFYGGDDGNTIIIWPNE